MTIVYIISDINKALAFEWIAQHLDAQKFQLKFILINSPNSYLGQWLQENQWEVQHVQANGKKAWLKGMSQIRQLLHKWQADTVHCHLYIANILGLTAAKWAGVKQRIYTRHHSDFHHVYFKKGVLFDRWCNRLATHIVSISSATRKVLIEKEAVLTKKIIDIPHGFDLALFQNVPSTDVEALRSKYQIPEEAFVVGVNARWTAWKGIQYIIPAFQTFLQTRPNAVLLMLGCKGDDQAWIQSLLDALPQSAYRTITFEPQIQAAYQLMQVYVHTPIDALKEAFGQTYVEALAAGIPSVFTMSGIAPNFIKHEENALVVPFEDSKAISEALERLAGDQTLRDRLSIGGKESAQAFGLAPFIKALETLYLYAAQ